MKILLDFYNSFKIFKYPQNLLKIFLDIYLK